MTKPKSKPKKQRSKSATGRQARAFGHSFERDVVHAIADHFEGEPWAANVRRSDQAHRAWLSDVTGVPGVWIECQVAAHVQPIVKLQQAIHDVAKNNAQDTPVAVTRQKGQHTIHATLTLEDLTKLFTRASQNKTSTLPVDIPVTLRFEDLLLLLKIVL